MSKKSRIHIPGAIYHVILRGNDHRDIFADDKDRFRFFSILDIVRQRIALRYVQWSNWRHHKTGHLFERRYKAILVDTDEYLKELAAYIHLNPVRARMVKSPEKYKWSSHPGLPRQDDVTLAGDRFHPVDVLAVRP